MPWICQFKVLTLLPLSEITVSCWVSISMGLLSNTSSSILVFASPIVLTEIVICGGCPNFIFLANCCWKTRKENTKKKKKKRYLYYQQNKPSLARAPSPPASCTETFKATSDSGQKKSTWGSHCCNMKDTPSSFSPQSDQGQEFTAWFLILDDQLEFLSMLPSFANLLWILKHSFSFFNLCPRLRLCL